MSPFMVPPPPRTSTPPATPVTAPLRPSHWLWLVALLATASALRFYLAATMPTWFVEIFILRTITLPFGDELRQAGNDIHPPLQFVLRWAWAHVGGVGVLWQKSLSVVAAIGSMALAFALARRVFGIRVALATVALLTVNVAHVQYSQEIEEYSLEWLFVGAMLLAGWRWIEARRPRDGVLYVAASALGFINHYETLVVATILGLSGAFALRREPRALRGWLVLHLAAFALFLPFVPTWIQQLLREDGGRFYRFPSASLIGGVWRVLGYTSRFALWPMLALSLVPLFRRESRRFALFAWPLLLLAPCATRFGVVILPREVLFMLPPWLMLVAGGIELLPGRWLRSLALVALLGLGTRSLLPLPRYHEAMVSRRAAQALAPRLAPGTLVVHAETHSLLFFEHYHPEYRNRLLVQPDQRAGFFEGGLTIPDSLYMSFGEWRAERAHGTQWAGIRVDRAVSTRGMVWRSGAAAAESLAAAGDTLWREDPVTVWGGR